MAYIFLPPSAGGTGAVDSVNGQTGVVVLTKSSIGLSNVNNTSDLNKPISTATQTALDLKQDSISGSNDRLVYKDTSGNVESLEEYSVNSFKGINKSIVAAVSTAGNSVVDSNTYDVDPTEASPDNYFQISYSQINVDPNSSGFPIGTNGNGISGHSLNIVHQGTSDIGAVKLLENNFSLGNGTDPIDIGGISYMFGFGQVNANATVSGSIQGYGFQPSFNAAAVIDTGVPITAFYDNSTIACGANGYTSYNAAPSIASIANNNNYTGLNVDPIIPNFVGNAGVIGINVGGDLGTFNANGYYQGVNVNPQIDSARYAAGINVSMDNVTPYAGVQSQLVEQDLTFTFNAVGDNDNYTLEYTAGATAGSEVVSILGTDITVQIQDGVSTATQIKAAMDAIPALVSAITVTISGTGSNPQDIFGPTNFAGGENAGTVLAAWLDGNVEITGSLTFGGALSIGKLNAFSSQAVADGGGIPGTIHSLVTNPTVAANATIANGDTIGVNTAMLLTVGDNATVTSGLVGLSALALPAVVTMGTGSTVDQVAGATFAVSLDAGAGGGTIANLDLCRSVAVPNGVTAITNLNGYKFDLPFGDPGTTTWGFYESPGVNNYFAGNLLIGGTAGSDDTVTNSSVALEVKSTTKAVVFPRMDSTQRDALTAVNGMVLYNTTTDKLQVRAAAAWVDLH